jgi:low affinity Fe/Cu permease
MKNLFRSFSHKVAEGVGSPWSFLVAVAIVVIWGLCGPFFHYSDTWQLVINTGTTIITFLMVFLIQCTQNKDSKAVHLKLDELIRAVGSARNRLVDLEEWSEEELAALEKEFQRVRQLATEHNEPSAKT